MLLQVLCFLPKSLRIAQALQDWNCKDVHAAYAGHLATTGWIVHRVTGMPFSCNSNAHDLFKTKALLAEKLPETSFVRTISAHNKSFILNHIPTLGARPPLVIHVGIEPMALPPTPRITLSQAFKTGLKLCMSARWNAAKGSMSCWQRWPTQRFRTGAWTASGGGAKAIALRAQATRLGIAARVTFHGSQRNAAVQQAMATATMLVVPNRIGPRNQTEGLPILIVEALTIGLPVIAIRLPCIPEIVRDGEIGFMFVMGDVGGLIEALQAVDRAPEHAQKLAGQGRALARQEFNQRVNARKLLDLIVAHSGPDSHGSLP